MITGDRDRLTNVGHIIHCEYTMIFSTTVSAKPERLSGYSCAV